MNKKALIITDILPRFDADYGHGTPIRTVGAYRIATALTQIGCNTKVIDYFFHFKFEIQKKIIDQIVDENTVIFGISATNARGHTKTLKQHSLFDKFKPLKNRSNSVFYFHEDIEKIIQYVKKKFPLIKIVVGGGQMTNINNKAYEYIDRNIDYYFTGESDISIQKLYKHLIHNEEIITYNNWKNIYHFKNTKVIHSDVDYILSKEFVENNLNIDNSLIESNFLPNEWTFVEISRGCIFNCYFCSYRHSNKRRNIESIKNEIINNYEKFGITKFRLMDDTFNDNRNKVEDICNMLISLPFKVEWHSYARTDIFNSHPDLINMMYESGCRYLKFGIESTNNVALKYANKGSHNVAHEKADWVINEVYKRTNGQLYMHSNFIIGLPGETINSQRKTFEWIKNSKLKTFSFTTYFRDKFNENEIQIKEHSKFSKDNIIGLTGYGNDWSHNTMTSIQAYELYNEAFDYFKNVDNNVFWVGSDLYPTLRCYGVEHSNVDIYMKSVFNSYFDENKSEVKIWLENNFTNHVNKYLKKIISDVDEDSVLILDPYL